MNKFSITYIHMYIYIYMYMYMYHNSCNKSTNIQITIMGEENKKEMNMLDSTFALNLRGM
jgi:hypothetical protein